MISRAITKPTLGKKPYMFDIDNHTHLRSTNTRSRSKLHFVPAVIILSLDPSAFSVLVNYSLFFVMMNLKKKSKERRKKVRENSSCFVFVVDVSQVQIRQMPAFS